LIYCRIRNIPNGFRKKITIAPNKVSNNPNLATRKYWGIKPNCGGITMVNNMEIKSTFFQGNLNFAKANPANELIKSTTNVTTAQTTSVFHIAPQKGILSKTA